MTGTEQMRKSLSVLHGEVEHLDTLGLRFAARLVRMAEIELQVRLHNLSDEEIDLLTSAAGATEWDRSACTQGRLKRGTV